MSRIGLAAALATTIVVTSAAPLRVIRVTPTDVAEPTPEVTVTFDRPVAGSLDASVDPAAIFRIDPAVPGTVEWRDPFTLRFQPDRALTPGAEYTVRITNDFVAVDGNALSDPYEHTFRVGRARVLNGFPIRKDRWAVPRHIGPRPTLRFLVRPRLTEPEQFAERARLQIAGACDEESIPLEFVRQRQQDETDPQYFQWEEWHPRLQDIDDGRRVVELRPTRDLPRGCEGRLVLPTTDGPSPEVLTWGFQTYGPLALASGQCAAGRLCPTGPLHLRFNNPVKGAEVLRHLRIEPETALTVNDTARVSEQWVLQGGFAPRSSYRVYLGAGLNDVFEQTLGADTSFTLETTGYGTGASYAQGRILIEREQGPGLPVLHINADTLLVESVPVPRRFEAAFLSSRWGWSTPWDSLANRVRSTRLAVADPLDDTWITSVPLDVAGGGSANSDATLHAVRVAARADGDSTRHAAGPIALAQVTDLGIHARVGTEHGMVWVTDVSDGTPRAGAEVVLYDARGQERARGISGEDGLVELTDLGSRRDGDECPLGCAYGFEGYVSAERDGDRAVVGLSRYDPDLAPWRFDLFAAWGVSDHPVAAAVFTERGIYRPGETVHAKAILRRGTLGSLAVQPGNQSR